MGRERMIKSTVARSLAWRETEEGAVDHVAALGLATRNEELGSAILRTEALNAKAGKRVLHLIESHLVRKFRIERRYARRVALAALHEYMRPNCIYCGGKGETHAKNEKVVPCAYCHGTGLHRYSDHERGVLIGGSYNQRIYEDALAHLNDTARRVVRRAEKRLGEQDQPTENSTPSQTTLTPLGAASAAALMRNNSQ